MTQQRDSGRDTMMRRQDSRDKRQLLSSYLDHFDDTAEGQRKRHNDEETGEQCYQKGAKSRTFVAS